MTVPALSMVCMALACAASVIIFAGLLLYFRIKKRADLPPFFVGCAVFLIFARILEALVHQLVLGSPAGARIQEDIALYAIYGGLMAGLFEEIGRFLAFRTVLRRYGERDIDSLMYGAGHGGMEVLMLLGLTMVNNLIYSVMINTGGAAALTGELTGEMLEQMEGVFQQLATTPAWQFLLGILERCFAVVIHLGLSVVVWFSVNGPKKRGLLPLAILLHALVDGIMVVLAKYLPAAAVEVFVGLAAVILAILAKLLWKRYARPDPQQ